MTPAELKAALNDAVDEAITYGAGESLCRAAERARKLTPADTAKLLLAMKGGSLKKELHEMNADFTSSAFVQHRHTISSLLMEEVLARFNAKCADIKTYQGYRVLAIDGTVVNMARNPDSDSYMQNASVPKGWNALHANPLYDVLNKIYVDCVIQPQPKADEIGALLYFLSWRGFSEKTLIVADRGYESYDVLAWCLEKNVDFLIRVKQNRSAMREIAKLPMEEFDRDISWTITTTQTKADKENGYILLQQQKNEKRAYSAKTRAGRWDFPSPYHMTVRVVRVLLDTGEYETLVTSLPRSITAEEIKELYHARWGIETAFRELKYGLGLVNLHGKSNEFVSQEILAAMIMSNFCSRIASQVVINQKQKNIYEYKVNMKMAIGLCKNYYRTQGADEEKLLRDIARYTEPIRPNRRDERNIKTKSFVGFTYRVAA